MNNDCNNCGECICLTCENRDKCRCDICSDKALIECIRKIHEES